MCTYLGIFNINFNAVLLETVINDVQLYELI